MEKHIIIVGSGISGLSLAYKLHQHQPNLAITIITKQLLNDCNTRYAQGGIAAVIDQSEDSFDQHIKDTLQCGLGLCDTEIVEMVVREAPARILELIEWGTRFDKNSNNTFDLAIEGGHTHARVLHHKDITGLEIESVLIAQIRQCKNIKVLENHSALDLIIRNLNNASTCVGISVCDWKQKKIKTIAATKVILASGGCGQVYSNTTNPNVASGDGYAIAARAGAELRDMRFMQFHPTALYTQLKGSFSFLISEAVRGFGAHVINKHGKRFLYTYDARGELATRDKVSAAIMDHLNKTGEKFVFMDLKHCDQNKLKQQFPNILAQLKLVGLDPAFDLIPVTPSAHYQCGGIRVNKNGETNLKNVFAIGEVSSTGLHGANRLASNSLLEALVFAHKVMQYIIQGSNEQEFKNVLEPEEHHFNEFVSTENLSLYVEEIKKLMTAGAFSDLKESLQKKLESILKIEQHAEQLINTKCYSYDLLELRNMAFTARCIMQDKLKSLRPLSKSKSV